MTRKQSVSLNGRITWRQIEPKWICSNMCESLYGLRDNNEARNEKLVNRTQAMKHTGFHWGRFYVRYQQVKSVKQSIKTGTKILQCNLLANRWITRLIWQSLPLCHQKRQHACSWPRQHSLKHMRTYSNRVSHSAQLRSNRSKLCVRIVGEITNRRELYQTII